MSNLMTLKSIDLDSMEPDEEIERQGEVKRNPRFLVWRFWKRN